MPIGFRARHRPRRGVGPTTTSSGSHCQVVCVLRPFQELTFTYHRQAMMALSAALTLLTNAVMARNTVHMQRAREAR